MNDKKTDKKEELLRNISNAKEKAKDLSSKAIELNRKAQFTADLAAYQQEFVNVIPDDSFFSQNQWKNSISSWAKLSDNVEQIGSSLDNTLSFDFATDSSSMSSIAIISVSNIAMLPQEIQRPARISHHKHMELFEQSSLSQSIDHHLNRLGLSSIQSGIESVKSLIDQANASYTSPSVQDVSPSAVLIPLREAINRALSLLLKMRPQQEKTKNHREKVKSLVRQCGQSFIDNQEIDKLANEAYDLNDLLSSAKQTQMERDQVRELLNRGLIFVNTFLKALDENKLR